jgi:hypothetical protein
VNNIRICRDDDRAAVLAIINATAEAYRGVIPVHATVSISPASASSKRFVSLDSIISIPLRNVPLNFGRKFVLLAARSAAPAHAGTCVILKSPQRPQDSARGRDATKVRRVLARLTE